MVRTVNGKKLLSAPLSRDDIKDIRIGDIIYISGRLFTGRDSVHSRVVDEGLALPAESQGGVIMHAGPIVKAHEGGSCEMISVGPTTSMRMEHFEYEFIKETGVRVIIGKGGMGERTAAACREFGALHCVFPAGNAVVAALRFEEIVSVGWPDLGMAEAVWNCRVKDFGPLVVSIDSEGRNLFEEKKLQYSMRKEEQIEKLLPYVRRIRI